MCRAARAAERVGSSSRRQHLRGRPSKASRSDASILQAEVVAQQTRENQGSPGPSHPLLSGSIWDTGMKEATARPGLGRHSPMPPLCPDPTRLLVTVGMMGTKLLACVLPASRFFFCACSKVTGCDIGQSMIRPRVTRPPELLGFCRKGLFFRT